MNRRTRDGVRRSVLSLLLISLFALLTACVGLIPLAFQAPIVWKGGYRYAGPVLEPIQTTVALRPDGTALLKDFPQGTSRTSDKQTCLDVSTETRFTGEAKWSTVSGYSIRLTFSDSSVMVSDGGKFGSQDWSRLKFGACNADVHWDIGIFCGDSGYGPNPPCPDLADLR